MTMTNAEWCIKQGYKFKNIDIRQRPRDLCIYGIYIGNALIDTYRCTTEMTYIEVVLKWLDMEHKEPILDEVERKYLSAVIRPFRDKICTIEKFSGINGTREWLSFFSKDEGGRFYLPSLKLEPCTRAWRQARGTRLRNWDFRRVEGEAKEKR